MWKYTGGDQGYYLPGVPAADLSDKEWRALTPAQRSLARGFYEHAQDAPAKGEATKRSVRAQPETTPPESPATQ